MASTTGPLAGYETTFITQGEFTAEGLKTLQERLSSVIQSFEGEVVLSEDWGKRKLAYPIKKESRGQYTYIVYTGNSGVVHEVERNLRLHDHVMRFLTINLAQEFDANQFRKSRLEFHANARKRDEEREARREERNERRYEEKRSEDEYEFQAHDGE